MLRVSVAVVCAACVACASIPDRKSDPESGSVTTDAEGAVVSGPVFSLTMSPTGVRLPISLDLNGHEMLAPGTCPEPALAGVAVAPMVSAVGGSTTASLEPENMLTAKLRGPAVVQLEVAYAVPYACLGLQSLVGGARFTVFPSGRIVRNDFVRATTAATLDAATCSGCDPTPRGEATFESFWNFRPGTRVEIAMNGADRVLAPAEVGAASFACAQYDDHTVALGWSNVGRTSSIEQAGGQLAFRYDLAPAALLTNSVEEATSVFVFAEGRQPCLDVATRIVPPDLVIDDGTVRDLVLDQDFLFSLPGPIRRQFEIRSSDGTGFTEGFAVRLDLGDVEHLRVERATGAEIRYQTQRAGADTILWVEGGILGGDAVIVETL